MTSQEYLTVVGEMIRTRMNLISQRLGWMFALQGLLFTAERFLVEDERVDGCDDWSSVFSACLSPLDTVRADVCGDTRTADNGKGSEGLLGEVMSIHCLQQWRKEQSNWLASSCNSAPWVIGAA